MAVMLYFNFTACSNDDVPSEPQSPKEYTVSLGFTGEISVSESPLSRASGNDLYGIQVYSCPDVDGATTYTYYAYGLFDDTSLMTLKLVSGYKYKFVATMIVDGKNKIFYGAYSNTEEGYHAPFDLAIRNGSTSTASPAAITNSFLTTSTTYLETVSYSIARLAADGQTYNRPCVDRFHGELVDYAPTADGTVKINMSRLSFGAKFIAEDFTEGEISVGIEYAPQMKITYPYTTIQGIFTMNNLNYSTDVSNVTIEWTKDNGTVVPLGTHEITFKRNKLTTVTIKVADITIENGIGITLESEEMGEGDNLTVENGELIDTTVETE